MTSTDLLVAGVIAALFAFVARLYEMKAAFGAVIVCVALATTIVVIMATTVAMRMTPGREYFWIRIAIAFILFGFLSVLGFLYRSQLDLGRSRQASQRRSSPCGLLSRAKDKLKRRMTKSRVLVRNPRGPVEVYLTRSQVGKDKGVRESQCSIPLEA